MIDNPLWSRCSLGRDRWYWVLYRSWSEMCDQADPIATGYADSPESCEANLDLPQRRSSMASQPMTIWQLGERAIVFHRHDPPEVPPFIIGKLASFVMVSPVKSNRRKIREDAIVCGRLVWHVAMKPVQCLDLNN